MTTDSDLPPSTPRDVRVGATDPADVAFPLRWGIISAGRISAQWAMCLHACAGATVTAVAARSTDRAREFARKYGVASAYGSYAEMVASPDVDIVYVGTINRLHKEHSLLAIEAGKHVLCEKLLAETGADGRAMYAAAEEHGVMLQDAVWTRFFPAVEHARMLIEAGAIGEVVLVQSDFGDPIYTVQAAPLAFGSDATPTAVTVAGRRPGGAIVEYGPDKCAVLTFPARPSEFVETTEIVGREGRITLEQPAHAPTTITLRIPPPGCVPSRYVTDNVPAPAQRFEYPLPAAVSFPERAYPNQQGFLYQAEAVHRCLAAGLRQCPQYDKQESLHALDIVAEINALAPRG